ncbi:rhodanese-like domain-containing protein [Candidatus Colwellia aromaticivorans]|uniref:rhodanese-like domain-containing protein n=1 Tax=Candidatus Colwellia aromaticivorans TaxID=2267621 RepID=UPI000DF352CD|nr:rhodanese-like domain-containing protein [Candidatus Colwellia aromaticivorans]
MLIIKKLVILAVCLFSTVVFAGETPQISQQELLTALKAPNHNIVVLDVRSAQEYENGHLVDAINVSHNTIEQKLIQLSQYKDSTVVVYCRSGYRAGIAANTLTENGFKNLRHLTGDMNGWLEAKLPIVTGKQAH